MSLQADILRQIDGVLERYRQLRARSQYENCSDQPDVDTTDLAVLMCETINRLGPPNSQYVESMKALVKKYSIENAGVIPHIVGILRALRTAYDAGYLENVTQLIHADIFTDFIEMADHLLFEGYKDPAAVITGSTLEEHLRQLCANNGIATEAAGKPKKADSLNAELAAQSVYSKLDQKSITAWLDLRNKAAHGKYGDYSKEQVDLQIRGVRDFMARVPA